MLGIPAIHASSVKRIKAISPLERCIRTSRRREVDVRHAKWRGNTFTISIALKRVFEDAAAADEETVTRSDEGISSFAR